MKPVPINAARQIGKTAEARRIAIIAVDDDGNYCITTWGKTQDECRALADWAEGYKAAEAAEDIALARN